MNELIDYAAPMIQIEALMKELHKTLLENKFDVSIAMANVLVCDAMNLRNTLVLMNEMREQAVV
jgi:hypothetical protein